jgi:glycosidase
LKVAPKTLRRFASWTLLALVACHGGTSAPPAPNTPGWWRGRAVYEVFVRSFADSNGDGIGDLKGLTAHLDYLSNDLGVDAVWLMPIFPSPSYHGYDVTDYRGVNPQYGTLADFDALVAAAHQRGVKVILDFVLNHSSSQHPWFVSSGQGPSSEKRDWYEWSATDPGWRRPWDGAPTWHSLNGAWFYGIFWSGMPDLNLRNAAVEAELTASMKFWLAHGVDGFRLDAVRYFIETGAGAQQDLPETHAYLRRLRAALPAESVLIAEAWAGLETAAKYYGDGDEMSLAFGFDLSDALKSAVGAGDASAVINVLARQEAALKDRGFDAPFLSNHDQMRVMRAIGGDAGGARLAAAVLMALPGTPFLYYGEEIGMQGGAGSSDEQKRTPFRWTASPPEYGFTAASFAWYEGAEAAGVDVATQKADANSLWNVYRRALAVRRAQPALMTGDAARPAVSGGGAGVFALLRTAAGKRVLFVANFGTAPSAAFSVAVSGTPRALESVGLASQPTLSGGKLDFTGLAARSYAFFSLD